MFLIEYRNGNFINGENIEWISVNGKQISFSVAGDSETMHKVDKDLQCAFVNNLQALNENIQNIESRYYEENKIPTAPLKNG